jgi:hypothetical protein
MILVIRGMIKKGLGYGMSSSAINYTTFVKLVRLAIGLDLDPEVPTIMGNMMKSITRRKRVSFSTLWSLFDAGLATVCNISFLLSTATFVGYATLLHTENAQVHPATAPFYFSTAVGMAILNLTESCILLGGFTFTRNEAIFKIGTRDEKIRKHIHYGVAYLMNPIRSFWRWSNPKASVFPDELVDRFKVLGEITTNEVIPFMGTDRVTKLIVYTLQQVTKSTVRPAHFDFELDETYISQEEEDERAEEEREEARRKAKGKEKEKQISNVNKEIVVAPLPDFGDLTYNKEVGRGVKVVYRLTNESNFKVVNIPVGTNVDDNDLAWFEHIKNKLVATFSHEFKSNKTVSVADMTIFFELEKWILSERRGKIDSLLRTHSFELLVFKPESTEDNDARKRFNYLSQTFAPIIASSQKQSMHLARIFFTGCTPGMKATPTKEGYIAADELFPR